ncbi:SDR family oxidoreductase [Xanthomonas citri]|uniref:SDR family oxidoreductase n=1 Tax=Xanthomonas citri TaxID=346 RepID=UPI001885A246|nr:SDR family oxidoreductase [Xanthomonas citri]QOY21859.1 SDR family oxidoreductase [Xanthomonas citri]QQK68002.1 SDR family oxidoreductase [Xanthomonas citri]
MSIGVSGASGKLGKVIVEELKRRGATSIVAISRSPGIAEGAVQSRVGDYNKPETLASAYKGLDRIVLIPSADLEPGARGIQLTNAINAAVAAGVGHIFLVSAAGTREAHLPALNEAFWTAEQHLIKTAARWTILRMNYYSESAGEEIIPALDQGVVAGLGDARVAFVSRDDLAAATAGALVTDGHAGAIYNITGPAALSGPEVAEAATQALGKPFAYVVVSEEQLRGGLAQAGLPQVIVDVVVDIKKNFVKGNFDVVTTDVERLSGRPARTLREVLASLKA